MKRDGKVVNFAIIVLAITMIAIILVAGTYAKYTSSASGTDSVVVAKWSFKVGSADITTADTFTFDLFKTIKDFDGSAESDVKTGKIIAPGTSGSFDLVIENASEVNAKYSVAYTVTNTSNVPIEYSVDGTTWKTALTDLNVTDEAIAMSASKTITVQWRWAYEGTSSTNFKTSQTDTTDTKLGVDAQTAAQTVTIKADVSATQVD